MSTYPATADRKYDARTGAFEPGNYYRAEFREYETVLCRDNGETYEHRNQWCVVDNSTGKATSRHGSDETTARRHVSNLNRNGWRI